MFKPAPMLQVRALVLERHVRAVLEDWGRQEAVQLTRTLPGPGAAPLAARDRSDELARCARLRGRLEELQRALEAPPPKQQVCRRTNVTSALDPGDVEAHLKALETRTRDLSSLRQRLARQAASFTAIQDRLSNYRGLEIPLDGLDRFSFLHFVTGSLPAENWRALQEQAGEHFALVPLPAQRNRQPLIAMTTQQHWGTLEGWLRQSGFQTESLPAGEGQTTDSLAEESRHGREKALAELEQVNAALRALAVEAAPLLDQMQFLVDRECRLLEAERDFPRTEAATLLTGWVPADHLRLLEEATLRATQGRCMLEVSTPDRVVENVPILLRHPGWLRPFAMLVSAYGLPTYRELEPTLFVALSYVLMFGMMFGDVGHGGILVLGGLATWLATKSKRLRDAGLLLLFCGSASMIFGFIYGSCFGLAALKRHALWHDPLEGDPMDLMRGAIGIGMVLISAGLILNVINRLRRGDLLGACCDKFGLAGILFYWGALGLIWKSNAIREHGLMQPAIALFVCVPVAGWALKEPLAYALQGGAHRGTGGEGGWLGAVTESLAGAFEAVLSYLANTISFVRLAAYAMSHAALLAAAFTLAAEVKRLDVGGGPLSVTVIVLGNLIALVLEGIIAAVQALRLEYHEFLGKFFSGGGQPFTPFRLAGM